MLVAILNLCLRLGFAFDLGRNYYFASKITLLNQPLT